MDGYLIDSNVISNYFSGIFSENATIFLSEVIDKVPNLSVVTKIEALSWRSPESAKENIVRLFVDISNIFGLSDTIVDECIEIRRNCKIKTPDAIIAATAIIHHLTLITSDNDFKKINHLQTINPDDL